MKRILIKQAQNNTSRVFPFPFMKHSQIHKILQNRKNVDVSIEYATCFYVKNKCFFSVHSVCCTNMVYDHCRPTALGAKKNNNNNKSDIHSIKKYIT